MSKTASPQITAYGTTRLAMSRRFRDGLLLFCAVVLLLLGVAVIVFRFFPHFGEDDAYITFRYARNLIDGHGLVYNPGERVEGYSSLLHVLLVSPAFLALSDEQVYFYVLLLNAIGSIAAMFVFCRIVSRHVAGTLLIPAAFLFAMMPSLWRYVWSGLESPLVLLLQLIVWGAVLEIHREAKKRHVWVLCAASALLVLGRADGFIVPGLAFLYLLLIRKPRAAAWCAIAAGLTFAAQVAFRYAYYGYPLPNTYYVKVGGTFWQRFGFAMPHFRHLARTRRFNLHLFTLVFVLFVQVGRWALKRERLRDVLSFGPLLAIGLVVYWFYIGGDVLGERFLLILFPLGIFAALKLLRLSESGLIPRVWLLVVITAIQGGPALGLARNALKGGYAKIDGYKELGRYLRTHESGKVLACDALGKIGYYSRLPVIDMLGLCDVHIAHTEIKEIEGVEFMPGHSKFDPEYVLGRKPDLIAARVHPSLDLAWRMDRRLYEAAGYRIKYLAHLRLFGVIDVSDLSEEQIVNRITSANFNWAVLERAGPG
ncbi:MAG TPA: hypothetical protein HPP77_07670 [Candidatus Hydrogenedentes bacterium]|nr:hypothetical protein [Candidatus Hydrogenedentota bacterium]HIJ72551.1 hypothetical protein [Candidatus Hydrogenedentota bacterium]